MRGWIPPVPLALGALFGALSWALVVLYGVTPSFGIALAWIHAVALGSFTTIALSVLIHVVPGFTDLSWRGKTLARWSGALLPFAAAGFVVSFASAFGLGVTTFGLASALLILLYTGAAIATLSQQTPDPAEQAIARAFLLVMLFLGLAAILGGVLAYGYGGGNARLLQFAPEHGAVAIVGWLTLLTMGVSARTFRPILGSEARWRPMHIASNSAMLVGAIAIPLALGFGNATLTRVAFAIALVGAIAYAGDGLDRVRRARTPNGPAHAFIVASLVWLLFAATAALLGAYDLAVVTALAGWLGQMINAHLHHIGVRVIATTVAGDENETRPWELLDARLSWTTVVLAQLAVVLLVSAVATNFASGYIASGCAGLVAAIAFAVNAGIAVGRARPSTSLRYARDDKS
ncbi:MAG TPA: hypothetical protein VNF68_02030 [Candidatus Baltobacteraceae bacterium]|nr:hypothetical protein [Candidatus Baltobacteraceae bacterium]